jgi:hypothetical protein
MTEAEYARKLAELDRLLNDPDVPMQPTRIWSLLAEIAQHDPARGGATHPVEAGPASVISRHGHAPTEPHSNR